MQRILGIDPGLRITGFGVVELPDGRIEPRLLEAGIIKLIETQSIEQRLEWPLDRYYIDGHAFDTLVHAERHRGEFDILPLQVYSKCFEYH